MKERERKKRKKLTKNVIVVRRQKEKEKERRKRRKDKYYESSKAMAVSWVGNRFLDKEKKKEITGDIAEKWRKKRSHGKMEGKNRG